MKLYSISRTLLFEILSQFDIQLASAGQLFASAFLTNEMAKEIASKWPNSISVL